MSKPGEETDLCYIDPKFEVDMYVLCDLAVLTSAWMGYSTFEEEIANERIFLIGNELISRTLSKWLKRSRFADIENLPNT